MSSENSTHTTTTTTTTPHGENGGEANSSSNQTDVPLSSRGEPKGPPAACLFVASLSTETHEGSLRTYFGQFGDVLKLKLLKDRSSRPYAFVQYLSVEDANNALSSTHGKKFDGRRLRVEKAKVNRTLFLAKMSRTLTNSELREIAEEYGPVESVTIIKNHRTHQSKGCGFVKFAYREDASDALSGLKSSHRGHKWVVEWATSTNDPDLLGVDKHNVFVGGLHPSVTKEQLEQRFSVYGSIENISIVNRHKDSPAAASPSAQATNTDDADNATDDVDADSDQQSTATTSTSSNGGGEHTESTDDADASDSNNTSTRRTKRQPSCYAFIRFVSDADSAAAIENQNSSEWLGRRIRVQYCESQEMKNKRRANNYYRNFNNTPYQNHQFGYSRSMNNPPVATPMFVVHGPGGVPTAYNPKMSPHFNPYQAMAKNGDPSSPNAQQNNRGGGNPQFYSTPAFTTPYGPTMFAYNGQPWQIYSGGQQQQQQQHPSSAQQPPSVPSPNQAPPPQQQPSQQQQQPSQQPSQQSATKSNQNDPVVAPVQQLSEGLGSLMSWS
eukprot:CAMPEP_0201548812 /NCGR_PEP_ID=MMETSP0173_2-20130828/5316_1 /ASSEMBLY_ACC=CAM_ASM_000268 /TAXON_ID=218659 /ORGANISM="Vexillifera sp., Strain DIVA3 564/2" /LENGTH=552 /DNA_ID=CAMNT_0047958291 /DNA_START=81 /DNA_END=1739 /DNA_ORIENTATION=+